MRFRTRPSLIARLRDSRDQAAWREFMISYQPFIRQVGIKVGTPRQTLADMTQDVLLTVVRALPTFVYDPARGRFRSWLARVVRSRCCDLSRRRRREAAASKRLAGPARNPLDACDIEGDIELLRRAIAAVFARTRPLTWRCFQRHVIDGLKAAEAAVELGVTENSVFLNSARLVRRIEGAYRALAERERAHASETLPR